MGCINGISSMSIPEPSLSTLNVQALLDLLSFLNFSKKATSSWDPQTYTTLSLSFSLSRAFIKSFTQTGATFSVPSPKLFIIFHTLPVSFTSLNLSMSLSSGSTPTFGSRSNSFKASSVSLPS